MTILTAHNQYDINPRIDALSALGFTFVCTLDLLMGRNALAVLACDLWRTSEYNYHIRVNLGVYSPLPYY